MKVYVLTITHNTGSNVSVHASERAADRHLVAYVKDNWDGEPLSDSASDSDIIDGYFSEKWNENWDITTQEMNNAVTEESADDRAQVATIIAANLYDKMCDDDTEFTHYQWSGMLHAYETIATIAKKFKTKYGWIGSPEVGWEILLDGDEGDSPFPSSVMCWDDAVVYFAEQELGLQ